MVARRWLRCLLVASLGLMAAASVGCAQPGGRTGHARAEDAVPYTVSTVELPYRACTKPQKVGSSIYTAVSRGQDEGSSIVRYDLDSKRIETLVETLDPDSIGWFVVNERWLVWSVGRQLFARSLSTGDDQLLSESRDLYAPALYGDLVAWDDLTEQRTHQIVVRDLASGDSTVVAPVALADLYNNFPAWDEGRLVWTDVVDGIGVYRSYDSSSGMIDDHALTEGDFRYPGYAQAAGERIYSINFDRIGVWDWGVQRVGYFSVPEQRFVPIVPEGFVANSLDVAGGLVAIVDSEQELTLRSIDEPQGTIYRPVGGRVDFVQVSWDGTLIAWREAATDSGRCRLFLIEKS